MAPEIEVKVRVESERVGLLRRRSAELGFQRKHERALEQNCLFDSPDRILTERGSALRLRRYGDRVLLTYKGPRIPDQHFKMRDEIETVVEDFDSMQQVLEALGFLPAFRYEKFREQYVSPVDGVELCIDETPFGCFAEIEGSPEAIRRVAADFGWQTSDFITRNYVEMYREQGLGGA